MHASSACPVARKTDLRVAPEIEKLKGKKIFCVYGVEEEDTLCGMLPSGLVRPAVMKDGHHYGGDYKTIADLILKEAK
jgi:type IV secretory pathway VirJ component